MSASLLMAAGSGVILTLGLLHLLYTFHGPKLLPRDPALIARMREVHPVITRETTVWKCWIGFNATHSLSAILFGLIYGWLALEQPALLLGSPFLLSVAIGSLLFFTVIGRLYFFSVPFAGICIALACFVAALLT